MIQAVSQLQSIHVETSLVPSSGNMGNREVTRIPPTSYAEPQEQKKTAITVEVSSLALIIIGGAMWGACPTDGCRTAGIVLTSFGIAGVAITSCVLVCVAGIFCCCVKD